MKGIPVNRDRVVTIRGHKSVRYITDNGPCAAMSPTTNNQRRTYHSQAKKSKRVYELNSPHQIILFQPSVQTHRNSKQIKQAQENSSKRAGIQFPNAPRTVVSDWRICSNAHRPLHLISPHLTCSHIETNGRERRFLSSPNCPDIVVGDLGITPTYHC